MAARRMPLEQAAKEVLAEPPGYWDGDPDVMMLARAVLEAARMARAPEIEPYPRIRRAMWSAMKRAARGR